VRWSRSDLFSALTLGLGVLAIGALRAPLAQQFQGITAKHDVYLLPPPDQTVVMSLGYRSAAADLIFGHVMVAAGLHLAEKRLFEFAGPYLETINELDPKFRAPYRYADAIITLQSVEVPEEMHRQARRIVLRGTRELPYDQELWSTAGQFLAYLAPGRLKDPAEAEAFRQEGARLMAHACELVGSNETIPYQCITAATLFSNAGNVAASRAFLERFLEVVDDPELRKMAERKLASLAGGAAESERQLRAQRFSRAWRDDLPFVSRAAITAIGPRFDAAACAGLRTSAGTDCATSFRDLLGHVGDEQ